MANEMSLIDELKSEPISKDFLEYCRQLDTPRYSFSRKKSDSYFRHLGYSSHSVPEVDESLIVEDLGLHGKRPDDI